MVSHHRPLEMMETVLEVADVAWKSMELTHHYTHHNNHKQHTERDDSSLVSCDELEALRSENLRLRAVLEDNLKLLQNLSQSPSLASDCPADLYTRLVAAADSANFMSQLELLRQSSVDEGYNSFPFKKVTGPDLESVETLVNVGLNEPSWWVWVMEEKPPPGGIELSGIDNEGYVIVSEEQVVDGVANFIARCILSNPKAQKMTPAELQKTVATALEGVSKFDKMMKIWHAGQTFYAFGTWGLALAGLYRHRAILRVAAKGVGATGKMVMKAF
ncbi:hypothetical protein Scep_002803 [Stephania cephalantha]|uniref:Uncharacterized protein n=1 Tax=Stephania cephalantha TaxID=152367 RepID=A0AAP0LC90_9MAGN